MSSYNSPLPVGDAGATGATATGLPATGAATATGTRVNSKEGGAIAVVAGATTRIVGATTAGVPATGTCCSARARSLISIRNRSFAVRNRSKKDAK